jgi:hypothetical protein
MDVMRLAVEVVMGRIWTRSEKDLVKFTTPLGTYTCLGRRVGTPDPHVEITSRYRPHSQSLNNEAKLV